MHAVLVVVGLALALTGYAVSRSQPSRLTRAKAVGWALLVVGEILLFGAGLWWGLLGLVVPPILVDVVFAATRRT
jgi:hypothetical protein